MTHNKIILDTKSKRLLRKTIHDVYINRTSYNITISFIKRYPQINTIINTIDLIPTVLCNIICEYVNDIMLFNVDVRSCTIGHNRYKTITCRLIPKHIFIHDLSFDTNFEIYTYDYEPGYIPYQDIHINNANAVCAIEHDTYNFLLTSLSNYMTRYYNIHDYYNYIFGENKDLTIKNHKLMKHLCIFVKILITNIRIVINTLKN